MRTKLNFDNTNNFSTDNQPVASTDFGPVLSPQWTIPFLPPQNILPQEESVAPSAALYLEFSNAAYYDQGGKPGTVTGWSVVGTLSQTQNSDGMQAVAFQNAAKTEVVISFEGTNLGNLGINSTLTFEQTAADSSILLGQPLAANTDALDFTNEISSKFQGENLYVTGHSLGGEEAEYVEAEDQPKIAGGATFGAPDVPKQAAEKIAGFTDYQLAGDVIAGFSGPGSGLVGNAVSIGNSFDAALEKLLIKAPFLGKYKVQLKAAAYAGAGALAIKDHLLSSYAAVFRVNLTQQPGVTFAEQGTVDIASFGSVGKTNLYGTLADATYANGVLTLNGDSLAIAKNASQFGLFNGQISELVTGNNLLVNAQTAGVSSVLSVGDHNAISGGNAAYGLFIDNGNTSTSFAGGSGSDVLLGDGYGDSIGGGKGALTVDVDFGSNNSTLVASAGVATANYSSSNISNFILEAPPQSLEAELSKTAQDDAFAFSVSTVGNDFADMVDGVPTVDGSSSGSTLTVDALSSSFWSSIPSSPLIDLGTLVANNKLLLTCGSGGTYFSIAEAANPKDILAYANSDDTSLPIGTGITVADPGSLVVLDVSSNAASTVSISGDLSKSIGTGGTIQLKLDGAPTLTLNSSGLTSASSVELDGFTLTPAQVSMGATETLILGYSFNGTISGFAPGNTIDIPTGTFDSIGEYATLGPNNVLTVEDFGFDEVGELILYLNPLANYSSDQFVVSDDGHGGTAITVEPASLSTIFAPTSTAVYANMATPLGGFSLADGASDGDYVVVSDVSGTLAASASNFGSVTGSGSNSVTLTGAIVAINEELASAVYSAHTSSDTITVTEVNSAGMAESKKVTVKVVTPATGAQGNIYWEYVYSASWDQGYWNTGHYNGNTWVPGTPPGPSDNASISLAVTVTVANDSVHNLSLGNGAVVDDEGTLSLGGTLIVNGAQFNLKGELSGGTVELNGGNFGANAGTLSGVTIVGPFNTGSLSIENGLTVRPAEGSGLGTINLAGDLTVLDAETLNNEVINLQGAGITGNGSTVLGSGLQINVIEDGGYLAGVTSDANIVAYQPFSCGAAGSGTFTNDGTITLESIGSVSSMANTTNAGTIIVDAGASLDVDYGVTSNDFSNPGSIILNGGSLDVGSYSGSQLTSFAPFGNITNNGGVVEVVTTLTNAGTMTLEAGLGQVTFYESFVTGGVIDNEDSAANLSSLYLQSVTLNGTTTLDSLTQEDGGFIYMSGTISGASSAGPEGTLNLIDGSIEIGGNCVLKDIVINGWGAIGGTGNTLTLGQGVFVNANASSPQTLTVGTTYGTEYLVNSGTLAATQGNTLTLAEVSVSGSGRVNLSNGGNIIYDCATVTGQIVNFLDASDSVLDIGSQVYFNNPGVLTNFQGTITGFGGSNVIAFYGYDEAKTKINFVENKAGTMGVLSISDGTNSSKMTFAGDYVTADFVVFSLPFYSNNAAVGFATGEPNGQGNQPDSSQNDEISHYILGGRELLDANLVGWGRVGPRFLGGQHSAASFADYSHDILGAIRTGGPVEHSTMSASATDFVERLVGAGLGDPLEPDAQSRIVELAGSQHSMPGFESPLIAYRPDSALVDLHGNGVFAL